MSKLIKDLFNGNIAPADESIPEDSEYSRLLKEVVKIQDKITSLLPPEHQHLVHDLSALDDKMGAPLGDHHFEQGFSLAIKLILSCLLSGE